MQDLFMLFVKSQSSCLRSIVNKKHFGGRDVNSCSCIKKIKIAKKIHADTRSRRRINQITNLTNTDGNVVGWGTGLQVTMVDYFANLFKASDTDWD